VSWWGDLGRKVGNAADTGGEFLLGTHEWGQGFSDLAHGRWKSGAQNIGLGALSAGLTIADAASLGTATEVVLPAKLALAATRGGRVVRGAERALDVASKAGKGTKAAARTTAVGGNAARATGNYPTSNEPELPQPAQPKSGIRGKIGKPSDPYEGMFGPGPGRIVGEDPNDRGDDYFRPLSRPRPEQPKPNPDFGKGTTTKVRPQVDVDLTGRNRGLQFNPYASPYDKKSQEYGKSWFPGVAPEIKPNPAPGVMPDRVPYAPGRAPAEMPNSTPDFYASRVTGEQRANSVNPQVSGLSRPSVQPHVGVHPETETQPQVSNPARTTTFTAVTEEPTKQRRRSSFDMGLGGSDYATMPKVY
jgi:hypothetical protein